MGRRIDELYFDVTARTSGLQRGLAASQQSFRGLFGIAGKATVAIAAFGAAAVAAGIKATRMAASLDAALREVSTLLPGTIDNISRLREEIVALSTEVPETPELLTRGLYQVISAGISDTAEAMEVLRVAARAAAAGLTDTFTSVDAITTVLNAYQLSTKEAGRVSDVFFQTVKEGKLTFGDLSANIGTVATAAALAGVSIEEVGAALATMTKFGINSTEAAVSLNRLLIGLTQVTEDQAAAAKRLGVEYSLAAVQSKGLVGFLRDLEEATGGNIDALSELNPNIRSARAAFVLAGKGASEYGRILAETNDSAGATNSAFEKVNGSLDNQATLIKNKINSAWLNLGANILPVVLTALENINRLLESDATTLARTFEGLGLVQEALAIRTRESTRKVTADLADLDQQLELSRQRFLGLQNELRRGGGRDSPGRFKALGAALSPGDVAALFPTDLLDESIKQSARAQQEVLKTAIAHAEVLAKRGNLEAAAAQNLADYLRSARSLTGTLQTQVELEGQRDALSTGLFSARQSEIEALRERASILAQGGEANAAEVKSLERQAELQQNALDLTEARVDLNRKLSEFPAADLENAARSIAVLTRAAAEATGDGRDAALARLDAARSTQAALQRVADLEAVRANIGKDTVAGLGAQSEKITELKEKLEELRAAVTNPLSQEFFLEREIDRTQAALDLLRDGFNELGRLRSGKGLEAPDGVDPSGAFQAFDDTEARVLAAQRAIEGALRSADSFGAKALAVSGILKTWGVTVDQLPPGFREALGPFLEVKAAADETDQSLQDVIQDVSYAARGAVELASAFGLVGDEAKEVLNQVALIGEGIGRLASGDILGGLGGVASGLSGLVGSLFGGGPSPEQQEAIDSQRENSRRLRELTDRIGLLRDVLFNLPGTLTANLKAALDSALEGSPVRDAAARNPLRLKGNANRFADDLNAEFERLGVTMSDLEEIASSAGIDIDQLIRLLSGEDLNLIQIQEALEQAGHLFEAIDLGFESAFASITQRLSRLQTEFDVFDISDPAEQLAKFVDTLKDAGANLSDSDLARLAAGDQALFEELFRELTQGTGRFTEIGDTGALTREQLIDLIAEMESLGDRIEESAQVGERGDFQQVSAQNRFTVEQGDRSLALDATRNFLLEQAVAILKGGELPQPRTAPLPDPAIEPIDISPLNVTVDLPVQPIQITDAMLRAAQVTVTHEHRHTIDVIGGSGLSREAAEAIGRGIGTEIAIDQVDRTLGSTLRKIHLGMGLPPRSTQ